MLVAQENQALSSPDRPFFIIGMPGAGKSTVGKALAGLWQVAFFDLDEEVEKLSGQSIISLFDNYGEAHFRHWESMALASLLKLGACVVATGGGIVLSQHHVQLMRSHGRVLWLNPSIATITQQLATGPNHRPLLAGEPIDTRIRELFEERSALYAQAADEVLSVEGLDASTKAQRIVDFYQARQQAKYRILLLCSGSGSNAEQIVRHFSFHPKVQVCGILANKKTAYALSRADYLGIPHSSFSRKEWEDSGFFSSWIKRMYQPDAIILAGFLWKVPQNLIDLFPNRIVNIHPSLLPKYGGAGMYGHHVHEAVAAAQESETGITIHLVNEAFDEGEMLFQARVAIGPSEGPDAIAQKVHQLEYQHFPRVIAQWIEGQLAKNPVSIE